jgi:serine/threonine-protein kinase
VIEVAGRHLNSRPVPPGQRLGRPVPETLSILTLGCLEKDPERRPQSAREVLARLDAGHDVPVWTDDEARAWWAAEGSRIIQRARAQANGDRWGAGSMAATTPMTFVRRIPDRDGR